MRRIAFVASFAFASCSSEQTPQPSPRDAGVDAPSDADDPIVPIVDAQACGNGNGGTGVCADPKKDCPPEDPCWRFECVPGQGEIKVCQSFPKDAGAP